jgi:hypothetical protein
LIAVDNNGYHLKSIDINCSSNPIQSNPNPESNTNTNTNTNTKPNSAEAELLAPKKPHGENFHHIMLTDHEYKSLERYGTGMRQKYIDRLDGYIEQIGVPAANKKYKSHYAVIVNWISKDNDGSKTADKDFSDLNFKNQNDYTESDFKKMKTSDFKLEDM